MNKNIERKLCVTVYIVQENQFLLLHHKKLNKWLPPGGKVESYETPDEAAIREIKEETGLDICFLSSLTPVDGGLVQPLGIQLNPIIPQQKDHVDLIYCARPIGNQEVVFNESEAYDIKWFPLNDILNLDTFPSVIQWCKIIKKALDY